MGLIGLRACQRIGHCKMVTFMNRQALLLTRFLKYHLNAILVHGLFQDTLDGFLQGHTEPVAFVHFDADLDSSTKYVLDRIADRLMDGTIFVFDEFDSD